MARTSSRGDPIGEMSERQLLWWRVPERPGVGVAMLKNTVVWLGSMIVLIVVIAIVS